LAQTLQAAASIRAARWRFDLKAISFCCASSKSAAVIRRHSGLLATTWQLGGARRSRIVQWPTGHPHQLRTRNDLIKTQRTRSNAGEAAVKSTKPIDILPLITVWLQVRVLPGPPAFARFASFGSASQCHELKAKRVKAVSPQPTGRRRTGAAASPPEKILAAPLI